MTELRLRQWTAIGIGLLALLAYWPAVDNPFIADDYALLLGAEKAAEHCTALFAMPLGWRRLVSNFFFTVCYALFGPMAFLFYWTNLWLHIVNSLLVVHLVRAVAGNWRAAVAAGLSGLLIGRLAGVARGLPEQCRLVVHALHGIRSGQVKHRDSQTLERRLQVTGVEKDNHKVRLEVGDRLNARSESVHLRQTVGRPRAIRGAVHSSHLVACAQGIQDLGMPG